MVTSSRSAESLRYRILRKSKNHIQFVKLKVAEIWLVVFIRVDRPGKGTKERLKRCQHFRNAATYLLMDQILDVVCGAAILTSRLREPAR
jgi:hypothetical protein